MRCISGRDFTPQGRRNTRINTLLIRGRMLHIPPTDAADVRMRPRTDPPPILVPPIRNIMAGLMLLRASPIGHLIPTETSIREHRISQLILLSVIILNDRWDFAAAHLSRQLSARFNNERIRRNMVRLHRQGGVERRPPIIDGLARRPVNQVDRNIQASFASPLNRLRYTLRAMSPIQRGQHMGNSGLHPERNAREASRFELSERLWRDRIRVRLRGNFRIGRYTVQRTRTIKDHDEVIGRQQRWRAATEKHRRQRSRRGAGITKNIGREIELPSRRERVRILASAMPQFGRGIRVEIAIATPDRAKWDVNVQAQRTLTGMRNRLRAERTIGRGRIPFRKLSHYFFLPPLSSEDSAAMKASCGTSTRPTIFMRFLPSFCFSSSLRLRLMSPP